MGAGVIERSAAAGQPALRLLVHTNTNTKHGKLGFYGIKSRFFNKKIPDFYYYKFRFLIQKVRFFKVYIMAYEKSCFDKAPYFHKNTPKIAYFPDKNSAKARSGRLWTPPTS